jgi:tetratricopeptide (TPR) repeat protein/tRNA A-37 threonylcarbamoyl transferase component Bud32
MVVAHLDACRSCAELTVLAAADLARQSRPPGEEAAPFIGALLPGSRVDRYQILNAVGRGGMGEVYAAYHPDLDRRIALKVVAESGADSTERRARLLREARAIARLSHPNVVTVYDAGTVDDRVYIAMEFVEGMTVDAWLRAKPRGWREILDVFVAAGRGLAAAHAAGVVHRDFKPQNVMVGRDGTVRVMDFGLARLAEEPADPRPDDDALDQPVVAPATVTKTGALLGTIAYMAPEQFRRQPLDARADQFSFCVALHEAIYGRRPELRHLGASADAGDPDADKASRARPGSPPAWLRSVVARGLSDDRERRFPSMDDLLAAVDRGRKRVQRRTTTLAVAMAAALMAVGAWRLGTARRISCAVPRERLAAVWNPGDPSNSRRQAIHDAFIATGIPTAETSWQRVAAALDDYTTRWSAMYVSSCEATDVRGEQSAEVLDLRMGCLNDMLDGERALTDVFARADTAVLSQAVTAAQDQPSLNRCADVAVLRSAVPPPRDEATARKVESLRRSLKEANALEAVGSNKVAIERTRQLLAEAESTGYKPLIAEVLYQLGAIQESVRPAESVRIFERAFYTAEASRDDITAAKAAIGLTVDSGYGLSRRQDYERWAQLAHAILDRLSSPNNRLRAWLLHNEGASLLRMRDFAAAPPLLEQALALKEAELGKDHPDVARTLATLAWAMTELGRYDEALRLADRSLAILEKLDPDGLQLVYANENRGDALIKLGRYKEAEASYKEVLRLFLRQVGPSHPTTAYPLHGIGEARLGDGDFAEAIRYLEEALKLRQGVDADAVAVADNEFALARALVAGGQDGPRARSLATAARDTYASHEEPARQRRVEAWLTARREPRTRSPH